jgi:lycopene cyclase domain-containing protein
MSEPWLAGNPVSREKLRYVFILLALFLLGSVWYTNTIKPDHLLREVTPIHAVPWLETNWLYTWLLIFTGSFPLIFGFLPKLKFYRQWKYLLLSNLPVSLIFILWDIYFTQKGVWGFSAVYTTGWKLAGLPIEECLFFLVIPVACTFIYWSLNAVLSREPFRSIESGITIFLIVLLTGIGLWKWEHIYTSTATLMAAAFLLFHFLFLPSGYRGRFYLTFLVTCIPFLLVNGVLTGGFTNGPVVMYNPDEYFGWRVGTVPVDDFAYSFLMLFANVTLFEEMRATARSK